ncbi:hypothetical protein BC835DRAFT_1305729 [Cytidiella melzeri]|nr:hypothetical protein BC835DRAFT_1305729 [Cytidiella melzeri]
MVTYFSGNKRLPNAGLVCQQQRSLKSLSTTKNISKLAEPACKYLGVLETVAQALLWHTACVMARAMHTRCNLGQTFDQLNFHMAVTPLVHQDRVPLRPFSHTNNEHAEFWRLNISGRLMVAEACSWALYWGFGDCHGILEESLCCCGSYPYPSSGSCAEFTPQWPDLPGWTSTNLMVFDNTANNNSYTYRKLANTLALRIQTFSKMTSHALEASANPCWILHHIDFNMLYLAELHQVTPGSWQSVFLYLRPVIFEV